MRNKHIKLFENYNSYRRVIPRDFFNEAKLLKCMGILQIKIHDNQLPTNIDIEIMESGESFEIELDSGFDLLYIQNYPVMVNGEEYLVGTNYNSKDNIPLSIIYDNTDIRIFEEDGTFSEEFIELFTE